MNLMLVVRCVCVVLSLLVCGSQLHAQEVYAGVRTLSFSSFATGSTVSTGLGSTATGAQFGLDMTRHFKRLRLFTPSLELRAGIAEGTAQRLTTLQAGVKVERRFGRVTPYADFLIGEGWIGYKGTQGTYRGDNSVVPSFGGGVDFRVSRTLSLKFDYSRQNWKLGQATPAFQPSVVSVGVTYQFNFGKE